MGIHNSLVEFYSTLFSNLYQDIAEHHQTSVSSTESERDLREIQGRVKSEGISFLTKSLPKLGKAIDKALSKGTHLTIEGFESYPNSKIPKLFGSLIRRVFSDDGLLLEEADPKALRHLRQLAFVLYKLEVPYEKETIEQVLNSFVATDRSLPDLSDLDRHSSQILEAASSLTAYVLASFDHRDIIPRHGPGAVATGECVHGKTDFRRIYRAIDRVYPFTEYFMLGTNHIVDQYDWLQSLEILDSGTAKVVLVPKDSRGPRLISCEPLEYQWIQQGLGRAFQRHVETHRWTSGHVNFTNQNVNRHLALESSKSNRWVTLDMKDASDRVSLALVRALYKHIPVLLEALEATRSTGTRLPNGEVVELKKFAPMGSSLCFPVESFVFYALAVGTIAVTSMQRTLLAAGKPVPNWLEVPVRTRISYLRKAAKGVYVYGDDIIVRSEVYADVLQSLPQFGLCFNEDKCCVADSFRESCGCDAFRGVDVTPIKIKTTWSHRNRKNAGELVSYVSYSNSLHGAGYWRASEYLRGWIEARYGPLPYVSVDMAHNVDRLRKNYESSHSLDDSQSGQPHSRLIGFSRPHVSEHVENKLIGMKYRFNAALHRLEVFGYYIRPVFSARKHDGWRELLRRLSSPGSRTKPGIYALPRRTTLHRGWSPVSH